MATSSLHRTTALTGGVLALLLVVALPVLAGDGDGGKDGSNNAGGAANASGLGVTGSNVSGGGAGTKGGAGGGSEGGAGGGTAGANGADRPAGVRNVKRRRRRWRPWLCRRHGANRDLRGGNGGDGAVTGGGGGGGFGAVISPGTAPITISNSLTGGDGGNGGTTTGSGGNGGTGLYFDASGARDLTIETADHRRRRWRSEGQYGWSPTAMAAPAST